MLFGYFKNQFTQERQDNFFFTFIFQVTSNETSSDDKEVSYYYEFRIFVCFTFHQKYVFKIDAGDGMLVSAFWESVS